MSLVVTPQLEAVGGSRQDSVRDTWRKLVECQERIKFWRKMIGWGVGVKELEYLGEDLRAKYRSEDMKKGGSEKEVVSLAMKLKLRDDLRHKHELQKEKNKRREELRIEMSGENSFSRVMSKINTEIKKVRQREKKKFTKKVLHLKEMKERQSTDEEMKDGTDEQMNTR